MLPEQRLYKIQVRQWMSKKYFFSFIQRSILKEIGERTFLSSKHVIKLMQHLDKNFKTTKFTILALILLILGIDILLVAIHCLPFNVIDSDDIKFHITW